MDTLEEEFYVYQAMSEADIPAHIWKESKVVEKLDDDGTEVTYHRMDMIWGSLQEKLPNLSKVALAVLTIPHSNAREERVFSMISKNKTDFPSNLDLRRSLSSIMTIKMNKPANLLPCHRFNAKQNAENTTEHMPLQWHHTECRVCLVDINFTIVYEFLILRLKVVNEISLLMFDSEKVDYAIKENPKDVCDENRP